MLTRTILAASAAALAMTVGGNAALAMPLMSTADIESVVDETLGSSPPNSSTQRTLTVSGATIGSGDELTASNADTDSAPSADVSVNVDIDDTDNGISITVSDDQNRNTVTVEFIEVRIDNVLFNSPATISSVVLNDDNLAVANPVFGFDFTAEVIGGEIVIRWEENNFFDGFDVKTTSAATFDVVAEPVAEPGSLALVATALVAGGVMGARRLRRPS
jgi:hypothetical protein